MHCILSMLVVLYSMGLATFAMGQEKFAHPLLKRAVKSSNHDEWKPLQQDLSRADLFKLVIEAAEKENPAQSFTRRSLVQQTGPFQFPRDAKLDGNQPRLNSIFGIDVSHYTGVDFKFDNLKQQNVRFVYVKATQGLGLKDGLFEQYWKALNNLPPDKKVLRGAYHFLSSEGDGTAQADSFLKFLEKSGGLKGTDMPPVVDLEWDITPGNKADRWARRTPEEIINTALAWLKRVEEKTGRIPGVYTARAWWSQRQIPETSFNRLSHYKIWIADYSQSSRAIETPPMINNASWNLWQFSSTAQLSRGYGKSLDANIYKGTEDQFMSDFQISAR